MMKHLLAVQQICAGLTQVAQVYLQRERLDDWPHWSSCAAASADLCLPGHRVAAWAGETATPCRSLRAAAENQPCDPPHPNTPGSAPCALHSDTAGENNFTNVYYLSACTLIHCLPVECVLGVLPQSPELHWRSCSEASWANSPSRTRTGGRLLANRWNPGTSGRNSAQRCPDLVKCR